MFSKWFLDKPSDFEQLLEKPLQTGRHLIVRKSSLEDVLAQKCLKEADVTLAEDDYSDFELRLWDGEIQRPNTHGFCCPSWTEIGVLDCI